VIDNGVDCARFHPRAAGAPAIHDVHFVGSFGHSPNRDAIDWLLAEIWPRLRALRPAARLAIVGAHPPAEVTARHGRDGIEVYGTVADTAEFYRDARVLLAPIRAGSGTRLKLLEAFASGLPVVATKLAAEGLPVADGDHLLTGESAEDLAQATARLLGDAELGCRLGDNARRLAEERYDWRRCSEKLMAAWDELLTDEAGPAPAVAKVAPESATGRSAGEVTVSVILPTATASASGSALEAILRQQIDVPFEVLCVDSASDEESGADEGLAGAHRTDSAAELQPRIDARPRGAPGARPGAGLPQSGRRAGRRSLAPPHDRAAAAPRPVCRGAGGHPRSAGA
jgi:hypothetical protein